MLVKYFCVLKDTFKVDIFDVNYSYASPNMRASLTHPTLAPKKGLLTRLLSLAFHTWKCMVRGYFSFRFPTERIALCYTYLNEKTALQPISQRLDNGCLVGMDVANTDMNGATAFPFFWSYLFSWLYLPVVVYRLITADLYYRKTADQTLDTLALAFGHYATSRFWLSVGRPQAVIVSNDHLVYSRAVIKAAQDEGIPTFYVQHASVIDTFPPLTIDYAFLDGMDALVKYDKKGSTSKTFLVGMAKADGYQQVAPNQDNAMLIGICTNANDSSEWITEIIDALQQVPGVQIMLRPHPGHFARNRQQWISMCTKYAITMSDPEKENAFEFLQRVNAIMAGESSILLEAALMNIPPLYLSRTNLDFYGYARNGVALSYSSATEMARAIMNGLPDREYRASAKIYCDTIGTAYDGNSTQLISDLVRQVTSEGNIDIACWCRIDSTYVEAYRL